MGNRNIVFIIGNFFLPDKNAAGKYNLAYGLMLRDLGYKVVYIGTSEQVSYYTNILDTYESIENMDSYSMPYPNKLTDWGRCVSQFKKSVTIMRKYGEVNIKSIISFGSPSIALWVKLIKNWAKKNHIPHIAHCAENVRFTNRSKIYSIIRGIDEIYLKRILLPKADGVIVGGPLLMEYFQNKGCKTIAFPTLVDTEKYKEEIRRIINSDVYQKEEVVKKKRFIYVGTPFDFKSINKREDFKDRLDKTIELFYEVYHINKNFVFDIYGLTKQDYLLQVNEHTKIVEELDDNVVFHGKVKFETAVNEIMTSDFYIFHRDKTDITQGAFPTKASEPITLGIPLITNDTSYIFNYVEDEYTGFMINNSNQTKIILNLLNLNNKDLLLLRQNCLSDSSFDYRSSKDKFNKFLNDIW